jgi:hypothetical protein
MWIVYKNNYIAGVFQTKSKAIDFQSDGYERFLIKEVTDEEIKKMARKIIDMANEM